MQKKSANSFAIIGLGRFGFALAKNLCHAGKEVLVIDSNEEKIREATAFTDNAFLVSTLTKEALLEAGVQNCDTAIVCIGEKIDTSILTTLNVLSLGVKRVIAKAISCEQGTVLEKLGAEVVYPERDMAVRLANKLVTSNVLEYISLSDEVDISEVKLSKKTSGKTVIDLDLRGRFGLNIIAVKRGSDINIDIQPDMPLVENDIIVVIGQKRNISKFEKQLGE